MNQIHCGIVDYLLLLLKQMQVINLNVQMLIEERLGRNSKFNFAIEENFRTIPYIQFLIFDAKVYEELKQYDIPCEETTYTISVLYRYQLTLEELQRMNWTVVYPPEE